MQDEKLGFNLTIDTADLARRLDDAIEKAGGRADIAAKTKVPQTSLDRYCRGQSEPPSLRLGEIARACGVTTDFLIYGENSSSNMMMNQVLPPMDGADSDDVVFIPLLDVIVSAGAGFENAKPYEIDRLPFPRAWLQQLGVPEKDARFLDSRGDSMEPTIADGAIVLADTRFQHATKEGIYVLVDGNNVRIKRIAIGWQGAIQLLSDNERYLPEQLSQPDAEALRVAGKVVWAGGKI